MTEKQVFEEVSLAAQMPRVAVPVNRAPVEPIYQSTGWEFSNLDEADEIFEGRADGAAYGNQRIPNIVALEKVLARLEHAEEAIATGGGMLAITTTLVALLRPGDRVIAGRDVFGITAAALAWLERNGITTTWTDGSVAATVEALKQPARLVLAETLTNPRLRVPDLASISEAAHAAGALVVVDNTLAGPYHCTPLDHGVDLVIESVTKSLSGHHDVIAGAIAGSRAMIKPVREFARLNAAAPAPFSAWLAARGIATYALRQREAASTAARLAEWLSQQDLLAVRYPGLPSHPDHDVARRILRCGYGSVVSFELDTDRAGASRFLEALQHIRLVHSLGGITTTLSHPTTMTHRAITSEARAAIGIHEGFFRLAVGTEPFDVVARDLALGLDAVRQSSSELVCTMPCGS